MARFLQKILEAKEPLFSNGLVRLEKTTGNSGVDVRLIADITEKAHKIMRQLNLDIKDTTAKELYMGLISAVKDKERINIFVDSDFVLMNIDDSIISFNMIDLIESMHHELPFGHHVISHGQRSLRGELASRYINHIRTDKNTIREIISFIGLPTEHDE